MADKDQPQYMGPYPKMVYDPDQPYDNADPIYKICDTADDIPEGWVNNLSKCKGGPNHADETGKSTKQRTRKQTSHENNSSGGADGKDGAGKPTKSGQHAKQQRKRTPVKKAPAKKAPAKKAPPAVTLKDLGVTRDEAVEILEEEKIPVTDKDSDADIAAKLAPLLED